MPNARRVTRDRGFRRPQRTATAAGNPTKITPSVGASHAGSSRHSTNAPAAMPARTEYPTTQPRRARATAAYTAKKTSATRSIVIEEYHVSRVALEDQVSKFVGSRASTVYAASATTGRRSTVHTHIATAAAATRWVSCSPVCSGTPSRYIAAMKPGYAGPFTSVYWSKGPSHAPSARKVAVRRYSLSSTAPPPIVNGTA
jgi:hypothetical protein